MEVNIVEILQKYQKIKRTLFFENLSLECLARLLAHLGGRLCLTKWGLTRDYDIFLSNLSNPEIKSAILAQYLRALRDHITLLDKEFEVLVGVLLKVDWTRHDATVIHEYQAFIHTLVSAYTFYLKAVLRMLVKHFFPKTVQVDDDKVVDEESRVKDDAMFITVHKVLRAIGRIVPAMPTVLLPLLKEQFPFLGKHAYIQECYTRNLLQLTQYHANMRLDILEIIVDQMLKLDVRSPRQKIEDVQTESDEKDELDADIFQMEADVSDLTMIRESNIDEGERPMSHKEANKLDVMMDVVLGFIQSSCFEDGQLNWEVLRRLYREMLTVFERIILPTHASCHVQFIMFYLCSLRPAICDGFLDFLFKKVKDPNMQPVFRQASVAYMASLLARAKFISIDTTMTCLGLITQWILDYIAHASHSSEPDIRYHGPFYSVCQTLFYVFAFRHKKILETAKGMKWAEHLNLQSIVTSRLNPLKVCLPVVVRTFANITRMHQLAFCDTIIQRNRRSLLTVTATGLYGSSRLTNINPLDSFFPFDPYLLRRSGKLIVPLYQEFEDVIQEDEEDDDDDSLDESDAETETRKILDSSSMSKSSIGSPECSLLPQSPMDFMNYGASPGFKHLT